MSICHIRSTSGFYGAEKVLATLLPAMVSPELPQALIVIHTPSTSVELLSQAIAGSGVGMYPVASDAGFSLRTLSVIVDRCRQSSASLINTHDYKSAVYGWLASIMLGIPVVGTVHGWTAATRNLKIYESIERLLLKRFSGVATVSNVQRDFLLASGCRPERVRYIPNGIDLRRYAKCDISNDETDTFRWVSVGRLSAEKNHAAMFEAFAALGPSPNVRLAIVGMGPLDGSLRLLAEKLGITAHVEWRGFSNDIPAELARADAYVSSSLTEGMPMSVLEAMAAGLPVVATAVGSVPELLAGGAGTLVPSGDSAALSREMKRLMADIPGNLESSAAARRAAVERFSLTAQVAAYQQFYADIIRVSQSKRQ